MCSSELGRIDNRTIYISTELHLEASVSGLRLSRAAAQPRFSTLPWETGSRTLERSSNSRNFRTRKFINAIQPGSAGNLAGNWPVKSLAFIVPAPRGARTDNCRDESEPRRRSATGGAERGPNEKRTSCFLINKWRTNARNGGGSRRRGFYSLAVVRDAVFFLFPLVVPV